MPHYLPVHVIDVSRHRAGHKRDPPSAPSSQSRKISHPTQSNHPENHPNPHYSRPNPHHVPYSTHEPHLSNPYLNNRPHSVTHINTHSSPERNNAPQSSPEHSQFSPRNASPHRAPPNLNMSPPRGNGTNPYSSPPVGRCYPPQAQFSSPLRGSNGINAVPTKKLKFSPPQEQNININTDKDKEKEKETEKDKEREREREREREIWKKKLVSSMVIHIPTSLYVSGEWNEKMENSQKMENVNNSSNKLKRPTKPNPYLEPPKKLKTTKDIPDNTMKPAIPTHTNNSNNNSNNLNTSNNSNNKTSNNVNSNNPNTNSNFIDAMESNEEEILEMGLIVS